ncbi:hypothetical protein H8F21_13705 [Pseudomonas sp. P66]|uniref:Uncharacterized protein n=1 Tax=Pseudomonas arcuscaelestis TaxID=2710591 RepID=A0ABS2BYR8_9PSED|nr:hypothetical protein [Pseudomonas arcuscaelestis]MBM5458620.1 hypothetical protein [Pseudomonas arcuscaelestis]
MPHDTESQHTAIIVPALIETLKREGWHLQSVRGIVSACHTIKTVEELSEHLPNLDVAIIEFSEGPAAEVVNLLRFDNLAEPEGQVYGWTGRGKPGFGTLVEEFVQSIPSLLLQQIADQDLSPDQLALKYASTGEHSLYPKSDWRYEVACVNTLRGYWDWVAAMLDEVAV